MCSVETVFAAKAGTHSATVRDADEWAPAFALDTSVRDLLAGLHKAAAQPAAPARVS